MKFTKKYRVFLVMVTSIFCISSCSHVPKVQDFPDTASAEEEIFKLDKEMNIAKQNQIDVFAPDNFEYAEKHLSKAKKSLNKKSDNKDILAHIAKGRAYFKQAKEFSDLAKSNLKEVAAARKQAMIAGAFKYFDKDFKAVDDDLKDVTSDIEDNNLKSANKNSKELQLKYLDLELRSIKVVQLGEARKNLANAEKEDAKEYAPRSLAIAKKSIEDTDAFITANRGNINQIQLRANKALENSEHLLKITRASKYGTSISSEEMALKMEVEQAKVAQRDDQLDSNEDRIRSLSSAKTDLESEQALNALFEQAREEFNQNDAEVYKQGNELIIRLRGLSFPVAEASLSGASFTLLAKVQKVIDSFGESNIIVEGHSDSSGGKDLNQKLSTSRAEAVRDYFVSNAENANAINIKAIGYDFQKPLASNKTADGRALNRRVDVRIQPDAKGISTQY